MTKQNKNKKVAIGLFLVAYAYFFFVLSVLVKEATNYTRRMFSEVHIEGFSVPHQVTTIYPRVYVPRTVPCFIDESETEWWKQNKKAAKHTDGFFFVKPHKSGSSTAAGIHLRIARNIAARLTQNPPSESICRVQFDHATAQKMEYANRSKRNSFLWTIVRDPTDRAMSQFFHFEVSRKGSDPTIENLKAFLLSQQSRTDGYYLKTLSMGDASGPKAFQIQEILESYDFIAVMERMDESLVALQLLLNLTTADILYLNIAKASGGFDAGGGVKGTCTRIQPKNITGEMEAFLNSTEWKTRVQWDHLLHRAVNQSLEVTIESLGRQRFVQHLSRFQHAQEIARTECHHQIQPPCDASREGLAPLKRKETNCLWKDSACGTTCLDQVADTLKLWDYAGDALVTDFQ